MRRIVIQTPEFLLAFPKLHAPFTPPYMGATPKFQATALFSDDADLKRMERAREAMAVDRWGFGTGTAVLAARPMTKRRDKPEEGFDWSQFRMVNFSSSIKPALRATDQDGEVIIPTAEDIYAGCICTAEIEAFAYDCGNRFTRYRGVGWALLSVTKVSDKAYAPEEAEVLSLDRYEAGAL